MNELVRFYSKIYEKTMRRIKAVETVDKFWRKDLLILETVFYSPAEARLSTAFKVLFFLLYAGVLTQKARFYPHAVENFPPVEKKSSYRGINLGEKAENPCEEVEKKSNNPYASCVRRRHSFSNTFPAFFPAFSTTLSTGFPTCRSARSDASGSWHTKGCRSRHGCWKSKSLS